MLTVGPYPNENSFYPEHLIIPFITLSIFLIILYVIARIRIKQKTYVPAGTLQPPQGTTIKQMQVAVHLGERVQHVNIINEKDCIKVMLKGWLDKQVWKEINDILRVHQFAWLSNGKIVVG